jgi:stage V sporulation protein B
MAKDQKQSFLMGTAILTASTLLVKVLGLLFSIPLANLISTDGMADFYTAYDIFAVFLMISTAGLPIAVSRMVGTAYSQGRKKEADVVFSVAFWLFFSLGLVGSIVMFTFSRQIAVYVMDSPGSEYAIMALAPTLFFISIMSALRGYFQGRSNMIPTAMSQVIEAVTKVFIGVGLAAYIITQYQMDSWAAVGAIVGVSISAFLGTIYLVMYKVRQNKLDKEVPDTDSVMISRKATLKNLLWFAVPITLGSCFLSVLDLADVAVLMDRLQGSAGLTLLEAKDLRGMLGNARKFFDLPGAFVIPLSTSLLPVLSGAVATKDQEGINRITASSIRITFLISIPATVGMILFSQPICELLLFNQPDSIDKTAQILAVLSIAIVFNGTLYTTNAIIQAFGKPIIPVINMSIGGVLKITLSYLLTGIPQINVMGSAISTVVSYFVIMILNFIVIRRMLPQLTSIVRMVLPLLGASLIMGGVSYGFYFLLSQVISPKLVTVPAILLAVVVYAFCVVLLKGVSYDDVSSLPKGETIARLMRLKKPES